ncbi:hypothetical protein M8C21_016774, partial [Ambrosia artemisiifolia]
MIPRYSIEDDNILKARTSDYFGVSSNNKKWQIHQRMNSIKSATNPNQ